MPAIWDPAFRRRFYERWGRESAVISARCRRVEYPAYKQLLSIKAVSHGSEDYLVDGRRLSVEDDTYVILNAGRTYGSRIESLRPVHSFSIFFETGVVEDVRRNLEEPPESLLEMPENDARPMEFDEHVREHDQLVSPVLRHIRTAVESGLASEPWLDEQLRFLLGRMVCAEDRERHRWRNETMPRRPATRRELQRRLGLALTFIHTHYRERIGLRDIARAAGLSPFHFLRAFKEYRGTTPLAYLSQKRVNAAVRLIASTHHTATEIAEQVGFGDRSTLFRQLRASRGMGPAQLRARERS